MKSRTSNSTGVSPNAVVAGAAGVGLLSSAGGTTITTCTNGDDSFYCKFVKGFNMIKMVLFILILLLLGYFAYTLVFAKNQNKRA
jgi:hypothetical protein